ncbi:hypothetical protein EJB05_09097, partial [Eragrostis curvula]
MAPKGGRSHGSGGGGTDSSSGHGGGVGDGAGRGSGVGDGAGRGDSYEQGRQAVDAIRDIATSLGFGCTVNYGPGLEYPPQTKFLSACVEGNLPNVRGFDEIAHLLLSKGVSVDISSVDGTPLHAAAAFGKSSMIQILLEHHADVNKVSLTLCTPLTQTLLASPEKLKESTCFKCMKLLVEAGADLNSRKVETPIDDSNYQRLARMFGIRPIEIAAESGRRMLVDILFRFTSPIRDVSNWSVHGIIAHAKLRNTKDKVNLGEKDSKIQLKLLSEKTVKKQDAGASKPCPKVKANDKDRKVQLKLQGGKAVEEKDYSSAIKFYSEAINGDPADAVLYSNKSFCYLKMGQAQDAFRDANDCIRLRPKWTKGYYRKGAILMSLKEYKEACDAFMAGVVQDPKNEEMAQALWEAVEAMKKEHSTAKSLNSFD